jgi:hypothetical protein
MAKDSPISFALFFSIGVSVFGLLTTLMLTLLPSTPVENLPWRKPLIGMIFIAICTSGGVASFFPRKCSEQFDPYKEKGQMTSPVRNEDAYLTVKGHHPTCKEFSAHIMQARGHILCAACTGLFLGACIAILGAVLYFFLGLEFQLSNYLIVPIGLISVTVGFFQLKFKGVVRSMLNALFVVGAYLVLTGMGIALKNMFLDIYMLGLILFWIWTRILLSQWDHIRICQNCKLDCELKEKKQGLVSTAEPVHSTYNHQYAEDYYCKGPDI